MRLLIVDDGHYIVQYLKHLLDWKMLGIDQIETTTNSSEAKKRLEQNDIEILITDIRMPEISGIDLLQYVNENKLRTKVVFLSGHSEFEYAQKAVRFGAVDYLLKPVDKDDLELSMKKVINRIESDHSNEEVPWEKFDSLGYLLSLLSCHSYTNDDFTKFDHYLTTQEFCFFQGKEKKRKSERAILEQHADLKRFTWKTETKQVGICLKLQVPSLEKEYKSFNTSPSFEFPDIDNVRHHFYSFFYKEKVSISDFTDLEKFKTFSKWEEGEWGCAKKDIQDDFSRINTKKQKLIYLLEVISFLYFSEYQVDTKMVCDLLFNHVSNPNESFSQIIHFFEELYNNTNHSSCTIIETIHKYIEDHLGDDINLVELGKYVYLHPVYISKLYKQETGDKLSNYICRKRLEKASKLLINSTLHVEDIARLVGYKKPQYFIKLFKSQYGYTPSQYRRRRVNQV